MTSASPAAYKMCRQHIKVGDAPCAVNIISTSKQATSRLLSSLTRGTLSRDMPLSLRDLEPGTRGARRHNLLYSNPGHIGGDCNEDYTLRLAQPELKSMMLQAATCDGPSGDNTQRGTQGRRRRQ